MRSSTVVKRSSRSWIPALAVVLVSLSSWTPSYAQDASFKRGDSNLDGAFDISDAVSIVRMVFLGDPPPGCDDAADVNDDGLLNVTDPIYGVRFLFLDDPPPPAPFDECGEDPSVDDLTCAQFPDCPIDEELCLTQEAMDQILADNGISFSFCIPAGLITIPTDTFSVAVCPSEGAQPCGLTELPGCPMSITSITASVDIAGHRLVVRLEGRVEDLPIAVTESIFNTTTTCLMTLHGANTAAPFSFEAVIPLEVSPVSPGVEEITGVGESSVENVDMELTVSGNLVCRLFEAAQGAFVGLLVTQIETLTKSVADSLGSQVVGLQLCQ